MPSWNHKDERDRDPKLATLMRRLNAKAPVEKIVMEDWWHTACNIEKMKPGERMVVLACGHYQVTKRRGSAPCTACHEMILNGEDYDAFRNSDRE